MRRLFELYTSSQKASARSIYKQQSNLLMANNLFSLITLELWTKQNQNKRNL